MVALENFKIAMSFWVFEFVDSEMARRWDMMIGILLVCLDSGHVLTDVLAVNNINYFA